MNLSNPDELIMYILSKLFILFWLVYFIYYLNKSIKNEGFKMKSGDVLKKSKNIKMYNAIKALTIVQIIFIAITLLLVPDILY
ncbi:MAG: hypothetical protein GY714_18485 [Desulfobacterales bacterium]|nr:hypothetical protein [Desulfobacterales bacterium]